MSGETQIKEKQYFLVSAVSESQYMYRMNWTSWQKHNQIFI